MILNPPASCVNSRFSKNDRFLKNVLNVLEAKKVDYIFEEPPNLYLIVFLVSFFSLLLWIPEQSTSNFKKLFNLNHRLRWNTILQIYRLHLIFFSKTTAMWVIFWNEDDICIIISDCKNWFKDKIKKLINKQIFSIAHQNVICLIISDCRNWFKSKYKKLMNKQIIFYSPSFYLSEESLLIKRLKHHTVVGICSLLIWFNLQILNLLMKTY